MKGNINEDHFMRVRPDSNIFPQGMHQGISSSHHKDSKLGFGRFPYSLKEAHISPILKGDGLEQRIDTISFALH